jgi:hypothetical protein
MPRKLLFITVLFLIVSAGSVWAVDTPWTGTVSRAWNNPANWGTGAVPTTADMAILYNTPGPIIDSNTAAVATSVKLGGPSGGTLNVTGGTLTTSTSWIILGYDAGSNGTMTVDSGTVTSGTTMYAGFSGNGTLYMNGGTINVPNNRFGIAYNSAASVGNVYLNGGTINCMDCNMARLGGTARMDITAGKMIINGDKRAIINTYIANGWITAYGGSGTVIVDYNISTPLKTTVTGYIESAPPTKATNPTPANGATNVATNAILSWSAGSNTTSHDVYFGTTGPGTFRGNQTAVTYDPCTLDSNTVYYWQIDEKNDVNTTTGDVWSFTTAPPSGPVPINIHLSWNENNIGSTMLVMWATLIDTNSIVRYDPTSSYGQQQTGTSVWSSSCNQYIHTVKLTGLTPVSTYHYSCGSDASWSEDATFRTGLNAGDANEFVFAAAGDTRNPDDITPNATYAAYRIAVMNAILSLPLQPRFLIHLGDIPNRGRYQEQWDEQFSDLKPEFTTLPVMVSWGSHEDPDIAPNAYTQFDFPPNGITGDKDKYYSFDYGNAHFTVLFATAAEASDPLHSSLIPPGSAQYNWLVSDLQQASSDPNIEWKFISVHAPPYSTATRAAGGSCLGLRADIGPLIDQYGVDVVFTAHEHNFERTHLIRNDSKVMDVPNGSVLQDPQGTIYYVSGGAGAGLNPCDGSAWFTANFYNVRHFLRVQVSGKTLNIKAIQVDGTLLDEITIQYFKQHHPYAVGDFDLSGTVDMNDLSIFTGSWLDTGIWP